MIGFGQKALITQIVESHLNNSVLDKNQEIIVKISDNNILLQQNDISEILMKNVGQNVIEHWTNNTESYRDFFQDLNKALKIKLKLSF